MSITVLATKFYCPPVRQALVSRPRLVKPKELQTSLEHLGYKSRIVSIQHLPELRDEIDARYSGGALAEEFYQERLNFYHFNPPDDFPSAKSLIVVAVPRPQTPVSFTLEGNGLTLTLPPTYSGYTDTIRMIADYLNKILIHYGYRVEASVLPLKLLAARSGLAEYGRNNICYIPGLGSFFQLAAYYTDLPCLKDSWQEARMMERCQHCHACQKICPTGAIAPDRFLLHAERCLVFHNERPSSFSFPTWIDPSIHNCLMGCMLCQQNCPQDKQFLDWFDGSQDFSAEETTLLLSGTPRERLPVETRRKLETLELIDDLDKLPRNLGVFLGKFRSDQQDGAG